MKIFYCDDFVLPLPAGHRFPMSKYAGLRERIIKASDPDCRFRIPPAARDDQILLAHTADYLDRVVNGTLSKQDARALGFPWSQALVERSRRSVGATIAASRAALDEGVAVNLAGGTHHSFADRPQGFCVLNDAAIATRTMRSEGRIQRAIVIDCDVHQGNGTASILKNDTDIFTLSVHSASNFPFRKEASDRDVALPDDCEDEAYLSALNTALEFSLQEIKPQLAIYLAGADPWQGDRLGKLSVSKQGLLARDRLVYETCAAQEVPVTTVMAGGYAPNPEDIVDIHANTVFEALRLWKLHNA